MRRSAYRKQNRLPKGRESTADSLVVRGAATVLGAALVLAFAS